MPGFEPGPTDYKSVALPLSNMVRVGAARRMTSGVELPRSSALVKHTLKPADEERILRAAIGDPLDCIAQRPSELVDAILLRAPRDPSPGRLFIELDLVRHLVGVLLQRGACPRAEFLVEPVRVHSATAPRAAPRVQMRIAVRARHRHTIGFVGISGSASHLAHTLFLWSAASRAVRRTLPVLQAAHRPIGERGPRSSAGISASARSTACQYASFSRFPALLFLSLTVASAARPYRSA